MMYLQDTVEVSKVTQYSLLIFGPTKGASPKKIGFDFELVHKGVGFRSNSHVLAYFLCVNVFGILGRKRGD